MVAEGVPTADRVDLVSAMSASVRLGDQAPASAAFDIAVGRNFVTTRVIAKNEMTISVSELKARLLEIVREVEREGTVIDVERHGQVVARIIPASSLSKADRPWEALLGAGALLAAPEESILKESDFDVSR